MRTRTQEKTPSVEPDSQQPRQSRKRRASTASEASTPIASQEPTQAQNKRRKKSTKTQTSSQHVEEVSYPSLEKLEEEETAASGDHENSRRVHFSQTEVEDGDGASATTTTPHPRKLSVNRRVTLSPAELRDGVKPSFKLKSRASMSNLMSPEGQSEIDFVPLKELINQRIEKRLQEKKALIQIDGAEDDADMEEIDDMMVYRSHTEPPVFSSSRLQTSLTKTLARASATPDELAISATQTLANLSDAQMNAERARFEEAIKRLSKEASDAKAQYEILRIELQSLGFGGSGDSWEVILASIRRSFDGIRERLVDILDIPAGLSNDDLIDTVITKIITLSEQVDTQEQLRSDDEQLRLELVREIDALVDRLTEAEILKTRLESANKGFDEQTQEDDQYIKDLEAKLREVEKSHVMVHAAFIQKETQLKALRQDHEDLDTNFNKLTRALEEYRQSEKKLQDIITRMEEGHRTALVDLDNEHKVVVEQLNVTINEESDKRKIAEGDAEDKQTFITNLETRYEQSQTLVDKLNDQLANLRSSEKNEREAKEAAEADRDSKLDIIADLENKLDQAEADLEDVRKQLEQMKELVENERRQREAAEADLDEANEKIKSLDAKLHNQGIQANELRGKLFEIQQREKQSIKELQDAAAERDESFRNEMEAEVGRREDAEALAADRADTIADLEASLRDLESRMKKNLAEKDATILDLTAANEELQGSLEQARADLNTAAQDYDDLRASSSSRISELEKTIRTLEHDLSAHDKRIVLLERDTVTLAEVHTTAIADRDTRIAGLHEGQKVLGAQIIVLEKEKAGLERRVESEAESMLELQAMKDDEIDNLKNTIRRKQAEIDDLGIKAQNVDQAWNALMKERDATIASLQTSASETEETVSVVRRENKSIRDMFRRFVADATAKTDAMRAELEAVKNSAADKDRELRDEGMRVIAEMDRMGEMVTESVTVKTTTKSSKKSSKNQKRFQDSGVAMIEE